MLRRVGCPAVDRPVRPITLAGRRDRAGPDRCGVHPDRRPSTRVSDRAVGRSGCRHCSITLADVPDPATYRPAPGHDPGLAGRLPVPRPGGRVIYVGKAKSLRQRLNSYFADLAGAAPADPRRWSPPRPRVEWTVVVHRGRGAAARVQLDQGVRPAVQRPLPRRQVLPGARGHAGRGVPAAAGDARPAAQGRALLRPVRARLGHPRDARPAAAGVPGPHLLAPGCSSGTAQIGRPCLLGYIGKCSAPCVGRVDRRRAPRDRRGLLRLHGRPDRPADPPAGAARWRGAAAELDFERAARLRDDLGALRRAMEKQAVVLGDGTDADVVGVRRRRAGGRRSRSSTCAAAGCAASAAGSSTWTPTAPDRRRPGVAGGALPDPVLRRPARPTTTAPPPVPREILVPELPAEAATEAELTSGCPTCAAPGCRCGCRSAATSGRWPRPSPATPPRRSPSTSCSRAGDLTARSAALAEIQDALGLDTAPLRIECIDVSHVQGTNVVASLVVFEDGLPQASRLPPVRDPRRRPGDDVASIAEVVRRRFTPLPRRDRRWTPNRDADADGGTGGRRSRVRRRGRRARPTAAASTRRPAGPASSPTRRTCWSSTAARRRSTRRPPCWPSSASPTSRSAGWPSGWRRSGCPARTTR